MAEQQRQDSGTPSVPPEQQSTAQAGDRLIQVGGIIAAIGVVASLVGLLPLVVDGVEAGSWLWFVAIGGVSIGVGLALWGMVRAARARSKYFAPDS